MQKKYRKVIRFDEQMWGEIKEFFGVNFTKVHAVITLRDDMGTIDENIDYVYGCIKKNVDDIKSIELYGEKEQEKIKMTFHNSRRISNVSLKIEGEEIGELKEERAKKAVANIWAISKKETKLFAAILAIFQLGVLFLINGWIGRMIHKDLLVLALKLVSITAFVFILYIVDYIIKRRETGDEWIQFWVDEEHIEKYNSMKGWKIWQYIVMALIAMLPFVAFYFLVG